MKAAILFLSLPALLPNALADDPKPPASRLAAGCEVVMSPGMRFDKGANVNAKAKSGFTALAMAKSSELEDHRGVIRILEAAGAKN
jgi:hypothetical protein